MPEVDRRRVLYVQPVSEIGGSDVALLRPAATAIRSSAAAIFITYGAWSTKDSWIIEGRGFVPDLDVRPEQ